MSLSDVRIETIGVYARYEHVGSTYGSREPTGSKRCGCWSISPASGGFEAAALEPLIEFRPDVFSPIQRSLEASFCGGHSGGGDDGGEQARVTVSLVLWPFDGSIKPTKVVFRGAP